MKDLQVSWDNDSILSISIRTNANIFSVFGTSGPIKDKWTFTRSTQLVGLSGGYSPIGIGEIGVIIYRPACGEAAI